MWILGLKGSSVRMLQQEMFLKIFLWVIIRGEKGLKMNGLCPVVC